MAVGQPKELEPAPPPLKIVGPRKGELAPPRRKGKEISRRDFLKLAGVGVAAGGLYVVEEQWGILSAGAKAATNLVENLLGRTEPSKILESRNFSPTPSENDIRRLASILKGEPLGNQYKNTVSSKLQEWAGAARPTGYEIIYQGNAKDTVGRSILFGPQRSVHTKWYDMGFGWWFDPKVQTIEDAPAVSIRGIFKGWVKPPNTDKSQSDLYMRLLNPLTGQEFYVRLGDTKNHRSFPAIVVDNLGYGGDPVPLKVDGSETYGSIYSLLAPGRQYGNSPVIKVGLITQLDEIIQPGDVIEAYGRGGQANLRFRDEYGVFTTDIIFLRRFGGIEQIKNEINS